MRVPAMAVLLGLAFPTAGAAQAPDPAGTGPRAAAPVTEDAAVIAATREYQRSGRARPLQVGAYLVYPFGHSQPRVTCAPLRACTIQLEEEEKPFQPYTGDSERWFIGTSPGPRGSTLVVVQPSDCNLTTNLTVPTDRRVYSLTLDSPPCAARDTAQQNPDLPYHRLVRFYYPEDLVQRLARQETEQAAAARAEAERRIPVAASAFDPAALEAGYFFCRDRGYPWRPDLVFSTGGRTYIRVPAPAQAGELPALFEVTPDGGMGLLNYDVRGDYFEVGQVLDRAVLVAAPGRDGQEQRLYITRHREECRR